MSEVEALQAALGAEHAAVHVLGALGAATSRSATPDLFARVEDAWERHRAARDQLVSLLDGADERPVGPEAAYELPGLGSATAVARSAADLELGCAAAYAYLVASSTGGTRRRAAVALGECAVAAAGFGADPQARPGS